MTVDRARFARLLRWYPRRWRDGHGDVLLGAMLDEADRQGRDRPTGAESWSAVVHGLGARLDRRLALACAVAALLIVALVGAAASSPQLEPLRQVLSGESMRWVLAVLSAAICPALVSIAAVALVRCRGWLSEPRALLVLLLTVPGFILAGLAAVSFSVSWDLASVNVRGGWFADAWAWLVPVAWVLGASAITVMLTGLFDRTRLHPVAAVGIALLTGVVAAPIVGAILLLPFASAVAAAGIGLLTLVPLQSERFAPQTAPATPAKRPSLGVANARWSRALAVLAAAGGAGGIVYAFIAPEWSRGVVDATVAMGQGTMIALIAALPLLAAVGIVLAARSRRSPVHTWGPLLLLALSFLSAALAYIGAPDWERMAPGFAAGSVLGGMAIVWWLAPRLRGPVGARVSIAIAIGIGYAGLHGMLIAPLLSFVLPLVSAAFAIWGPRDRGNQTRMSSMEETPAARTSSKPKSEPV